MCSEVPHVISLLTVCVLKHYTCNIIVNGVCSEEPNFMALLTLKVLNF